MTLNWEHLREIRLRLTAALTDTAQLPLFEATNKYLDSLREGQTDTSSQMRVPKSDPPVTGVFSRKIEI